MFTKSKAVITLIITTSILSLVGCQTTPQQAITAVNVTNVNIGNLDNKVTQTNITSDIDSDIDGVIDSQDKCPNTPNHLVVDGVGCSGPAPSEGIYIMDTNAYFMSHGMTLYAKEATYEGFDLIAMKMAEHPKYTLILLGNVSALEAQVNPQTPLARQRAELVKEILIGKGVLADRIKAFDCGEQRQIAPSDTEAGIAINQRVYVRIFRNDMGDYLSQQDTSGCKPL